jgi:hypothetical protein
MEHSVTRIGWKPQHSEGNREGTMSKGLGRSYVLIAPVSAEYERDKGPMPSGYAKVCITLEPCPESSASQVVIEANVDKSWRLSEFRNHTGEILKTSVEIEKACQEDAIVGIKEGAEAVLQTYLSTPVDQVKIVIQEMGFHPVYSTIIAFKIASQRAIELALDKAFRQELLVLSDYVGE